MILTMSFLCDAPLIIVDLCSILYVCYISVYLDCKFLQGRDLISSFLKNVPLDLNRYDTLHAVGSYFWWGKCGPRSNSVSTKSKWCWIDISQYIHHLLIRSDNLFCTEQSPWGNSVLRAQNQRQKFQHTPVRWTPWHLNSCIFFPLKAGQLGNLVSHEQNKHSVPSKY